jgi:hypothetical protein
VRLSEHIGLFWDWVFSVYICIYKKVYKYVSIYLLSVSYSTGVYVLGAQSRKLSNIGRSSNKWPKIYYLELHRTLESTLSRWSRLHLQLLTPTNPHWAGMVGYGAFFLWVIHKEDICASSGDINRLMIIIIIIIII